MFKFVFIVIGVFFVVGLSVALADFVVTFDSDQDLNGFTAINDGTRAEQGEWVIENGELHQLTDNVKEGNGPSGQDPAAGGYFLLNPPGVSSWKNYTVSADFKWTDDDWWGIMFYYTDELNYYRFRVEQRDSIEKNQDSRIALEKFVGGNYTALVDVTEVAGLRVPDSSPGKDNDQTPINLEVSINGSDIEAFVNGQSVAKVSDSDLKSGSIAFYMTTCTGFIDNLNVTGPGIVAVEPTGKLGMTWAGIKAAY